MHKSTSIISPGKFEKMLEHHHLGIHVMIVLSPTLNQKMLSLMNILCIYLLLLLQVEILVVVVVVVQLPEHETLYTWFLRI